MSASTESVFEIRLPQFEGPFDLLLFFIERDELDIHNIPIASIADEFLTYLRQMQELNIEVASEFILVAATLMRIKAKMLIPRPDTDEQGNEIDPRKDLVAQLLIYKQFKDVSEELRVMEEDRQAREQRGNIQKDLIKITETIDAADELHSLSLYKLLETYGRVMDRYQKDQHKPIHTIVQSAYTIEGEKSNIRALLLIKPQMAFEEFLSTAKDRYHLIFSFMSILELLAEQVLEITIGEGFNNFWIRMKEEN